MGAKLDTLAVNCPLSEQKFIVEVYSTVGRPLDVRIMLLLIDDILISSFDCTRQVLWHEKDDVEYCE